MTMNDPFSQLATQAPRPRESVLDSLREELKADHGKKKSLTRGHRVALSAAALAIGLALTSLGAISNSPRSLVLAAAALSLSVGGLLLAGVIPEGSGRMSLSIRRTLVGVLCVGVFTWLAFHAEFFLPFGEFLVEDSLHRATACAGHSLMSGVVGSTALLFLWRRTDPFSPGLTGCLLALLGGAVGTTSVSLLCSNTEGLHLTLGHGLSLIVIGMLGVVIGRKWLTP